MINYESISLVGGRNVSEILTELAERSQEAGQVVVDMDAERPWGGFIRFDSTGAESFASQFFGEELSGLAELGFENISPKFLLVKPGQRLSWQRHQRRSELWKYLSDGGGYSKSFDPNDQPVFEAEKGQMVELEAKQCHRLLSRSDNYVLAAEVWRHAMPGQPSDEDDNERLEDDYNR